MNKLQKMYHSLQNDPFPEDLRISLGDRELTYTKQTWLIDGSSKGLRYGENPDQPAAVYTYRQGDLQLGGLDFRRPGLSILSGLKTEHMLQSGKHPGKINITDVDNGINLLQYLNAKPAAVILKHNNPCGAAWSDQGILTAVNKAYFSDRIAAFGGTVVLNSPLSKEAAAFMSELYFEVVAAPEYEAGALELLMQRPNLRILNIPGLADLDALSATPYLDFTSLVDGGIIAQFSFRNRIRSEEDWLPAEAEQDGHTVLARKPTPQESEDLLFAWAVEAGVTSNSVIFAKNGATVAIGTGEQDRVGCVDLTIYKASIKYADKLSFEETGLSLYQLRTQARHDESSAKILESIVQRTKIAQNGLTGSVAVSDGFFPFRDGVDLIIDQGVTAIAQPGGSVNDREVIEAVNEADPQVAMVFTGQRSFKH